MEQPGYVGSYAMDNVSMALHCVHTTTSFEEALLKAANLRGDSDSVCAVVGQLAGSLYGASAIPEDWLARLQQWDGGSIIARALMILECDTRYPSSICVHTVQLCTGERDGNNKDTPHRGRSIHCLKGLQQLLPLLAVIVGNVL